MRILLVEDDRPLAQAVLGYLQAKQFSVDWAENLQQARALVAVTHYSAVLLDLNLPDGEGLQLLPALASTAAAQESRPTVIVVTARDQVSDRIRGLDAGADDYLVKPYDPEELLARLRAVLRRQAGPAAFQTRFGDVTIDVRARRVDRLGETVELTAREWALLEALVTRAGRVVAKVDLERLVHGQEDVASNTLEVHVSSLRRKLARDLIQTVRGVGYRIAS